MNYPPQAAGYYSVNDIWGDTVNTASRMEQPGEKEKVNISRDTYDLIKDNPLFAFEYRGKLAVKGKSEMEMYFGNRSPGEE